jgi:hypothetical protein
VARIDYFNDPNAPKANSIMPSVTAIVPNERGQLLLVHKTDNDVWALPGGAMDVGRVDGRDGGPGGQGGDGIDVAVLGVVGIYTNPNHVMAYDDGEVRQNARSASPPGCSAGSLPPAAKPARSSGLHLTG